MELDEHEQALQSNYDSRNLQQDKEKVCGFFFSFLAFTLLLLRMLKFAFCFSLLLLGTFLYICLYITTAYSLALEELG